MLLYAAATLYFAPRLRDLENKMFHANAKTMGDVLDSLQGFETMKLLGLEHSRFWQWKGKFIHALNRTLDMEISHIRMSTVYSGIDSMSRIMVLWVGAYFAFSGSLTIGQYVAFSSIFSQITGAVSGISVLVLMFTRLSVTFERINDVLVQEPESRDLETMRTEIRDARIEFRNVSFGYAGDGDEGILRSLSLTIDPGEQVGVVGRNGSGKSTLAKLLVKLYDSYSGSISIGGADLRSIHPYLLRRQVFLLSQDVFLFSGTIRDNILQGNPQASFDEVVTAAKLADAHDFIKQLYLGYNHNLMSNGANLSGGQRAKIALARLFLSDPQVIILDEATRALDVETEHRVLHNLREHFSGRTIISIAHRLYTLRDADRILVLDSGPDACSLVEEGTYESLIERQGYFYSFLEASGEVGRYPMVRQASGEVPRRLR
jgi:ATP-binding cassette subfamily B protein